MKQSQKGKRQQDLPSANSTRTSRENSSENNEIKGIPREKETQKRRKKYLKRNKNNQNKLKNSNNL